MSRAIHLHDGEVAHDPRPVVFESLLRAPIHHGRPLDARELEGPAFVRVLVDRERAEARHHGHQVRAVPSAASHCTWPR